MNISELNGNYQVSVKGNGVGDYSRKVVNIKHQFKNGIISGTDEYGAIHSGTLTKVDEKHVAFNITIEPSDNKKVITTLKNGLLTDGAQTIEGIYRISRKGDEILLTTIKEHGGVNAIITCKKLAKI